ncbi:hypothetical protein EYZ11_005539 [Aspergillus tanneri]|uniref:Uncharacterized protein n=1 Tax=Aspergillus tanneri TaxID=1220188 RepID=A0A4S3JHQ0_9EURO|nr:hypothetical protein EYZ11_005539 [Aspergillus tanneri]
MSSESSDTQGTGTTQQSHEKQDSISHEYGRPNTAQDNRYSMTADTVRLGVSNEEHLHSHRKSYRLDFGPLTHVNTAET